MNTCKYFSGVQNHSDQWLFPLDGLSLDRAEKKLKVHLLAFCEAFSCISLSLSANFTQIVKVLFLVYVMTTEQTSSTDEDHDEQQLKASDKILNELSKTFFYTFLWEIKTKEAKVHYGLQRWGRIWAWRQSSPFTSRSTIQLSHLVMNFH